jgi:hypothetical protein
MIGICLATNTSISMRCDGDRLALVFGLATFKQQGIIVSLGFEGFLSFFICWRFILYLCILSFVDLDRDQSCISQS